MFVARDRPTVSLDFLFNQPNKKKTISELKTMVFVYKTAPYFEAVSYTEEKNNTSYDSLKHLKKSINVLK